MKDRVLEKRPVRFTLELLDIYFSKNVPRSAAELAYFLALSIFPALICVNWFIGELHLNIDAVLRGLDHILPAATLEIIREYVGYISANQSSGMLVTGVVMTLFSASAAFRGLMNSMDDIYERKSYTGAWQIVASVLFSLLFLATIYLSVIVVLTGNWLFRLVAEFFPLTLDFLPWSWQWLRFLILFALVFLFVLIVYRMAAPRGKPRPPLFTGAVIATLALVGASALFSSLIGMSSRYSLVYGSITSVIILLLWLYLCGNILILGNVFNCVWYRHKKINFLKKMEESGQEEKH